MFQTIKDYVSTILFRHGVDLRRASSTPFGLRWYRDIQFFPNGVELGTVLDVGANTGQTALQVARQFPKSRIYSFEPVPSTFRELVRNTAIYANIEPIGCAMGASRGSGKMTIERLSLSNRFIVSEESTSNALRVLEVPVDTVDAFCAEREIHRVNLLKIDTEGHELSVLEGAEKFLTEKRIDFILAECEFLRRGGEPHGDFTEIMKHVSGFGFHVVSFYTGGVDHLGWVWGDVLFRESSRSEPGRVACSPILKMSAPGNQSNHR
jgi:FkbM family methyltransferase